MARTPAQPPVPNRPALRRWPRRAFDGLTFSAPSWARRWRARPIAGEDRDGPRIAVVGNCQATGVAQALRLLLPRARVEALLVGDLARRFPDMDRLLRHLAGCDHVFAHFFPAGFVPGGNAHALTERLPQARLFPTIVFPAFHPDMVYVGDEGSLRLSKLLPSPIGPNHSAIALAAYEAGLSIEETVALYRDETFAALGYYDLWEEGRTYLLRSARDVGFDLEREFALWARSGRFMHVVNHPRIHVLGDLARRLAREAGHAPLAIPVEAYLPDALVREPVWPVHPAIAERYGVPASTLYKGRERRGVLPALLDLRAFVEGSFAVYRAQPPGLPCARVEAWRKDGRIAAIRP